MLVIGAHPDDEDTALLALLARGYGADAAYLSLSRGEGGQNLIGDELGVALGLLRSQELMAARRLDGAHQFFTRAYDFGYSRSLEETSRFWPPDSVLKDVVRIVRRFRPHVIVASWSGTPRDRHGQHQMAGVVAQRAFDRAADPDAFPELAAEEGLSPWAPGKLYRTTFFDSAATTLHLVTGALDPRSGRSYHQIAMASRSLHRSQDMGQLQRAGPAHTRMALLARTGPAAETPERGLFDGIPTDTSWLARLADSLRTAVAPSRLPDAVPALAAAVERARAAGLDRERVRHAGDALAIAAGLVPDAVAARAELVPGDSVEVTVQLYNGGRHDVELRGVTVRARMEWPVRVVDAAASAVAPGTIVSRRFRVVVPPGAPPSTPYFLERPLVGALYDWSATDPAERGLPFQPAALIVELAVRVAGATLTLEREVTERLTDQAVGEVRRPVRIVPLIDVALEPAQLVWPSDSPRERSFTVTLTLNAAGPVDGSVALEGEELQLPQPQRFVLEGAGASRTFTFQVRRPAALVRGELGVRAVARTTDGMGFDHGVAVVQYPHVHPTPLVQAARSVVRLAPIERPAVSIVGYVRGASDRVPEALAQVGLTVEVLGEDSLARGDLARYGAIVIGSRAYETDAALVRQHARLLEYVRRGGLLLVQYQQYQFVRGGFAPYPLEIDRPHDRVTDETAPVTVLEPEHPAVTRPNRLGPDDWDGWPQERGLYFAGTWDDRYTPLLEMADPGMPPLRGGVLVARYGEGTYVYTGLSFFRALPAGVPGAFRLFLNLLALGGARAR